MKDRNGKPNAIFEGEKMSVSLSASQSVSLADPQSAKQTNVILMKESMDRQIRYLKEIS